MRRGNHVPSPEERPRQPFPPGRDWRLETVAYRHRAIAQSAVRSGRAVRPPQGLLRAADCSPAAAAPPVLHPPLENQASLPPDFDVVSSTSPGAAAGVREPVNPQPAQNRDSILRLALNVRLAA